MVVWVQDLERQSFISASEWLILLLLGVPEADLLNKLRVVSEVMEKGYSINDQITLVECASLLNKLRFLAQYIDILPKQ